MPLNESILYMDKHTKHDTTSGCSGGAGARDAKFPTPTLNHPGRLNDNPLSKHQGQKWEQVFDFDKMLKQIRSAEKYYLRGRYDHHFPPLNSTVGRNSSGHHTFREQPQVQRLSAGDMHFYGIVPKQPFDVVVCDICLGIYTKMGFNNHMKIHHLTEWNSVSSKASSHKDCGHSASTSHVNQSNARNLIASGNPLAETTLNAPLTIASTSSSSRHKSSKSGSSAGSSRSRSKNKHHHHHHQQQQQHQAASAPSNINAHTAQASTPHSDVPTQHTSSSSKSSKKSSSTLNVTVSIPKEITQPENVQPITIFSSSSSNSSCSLPPTPKMQISTDAGISVQEPALPLSTSFVSKEKPKSSKSKKSKGSLATAVSFVAQEPNESSNSGSEYANVSSASLPNKVSSKRSAKSKNGKDHKQLPDPQLTELDQAISSITVGKVDVINEGIKDSAGVGDSVGVGLNNICSKPMINALNSKNYNIAEPAMQIQQVPMTTALQQPQQTHQMQSYYNSLPMVTESNNTEHQQQIQHQNSNADDNDSSILTLDDMLDSKLLNEILNNDEAEIHFDESELDKATQQQLQQPTFMQQAPNKRLRYENQLEGNISNDNVVIQQQQLTGKYGAFQQQQQQQQQPQQTFHVPSLEDMKMYTAAIDSQQYLTQQHQQEHQLTTIDPMQLQQLLYQQQQQQQPLGYSVAAGMDDVTAVATAALEQHQYNPDVIMCSAEQLHKEGKINAVDYATLAAFSNSNNNSYGNVANNMMAAAPTADSQFQVYNIPSLTDDDMGENPQMIDNKMCNMPQTNDVMVPQNHFVLPADANNGEQLIYEITANNQVAVMSQQRQQQMIAEFLSQSGYTDNSENLNVNLHANENGVIGGAIDAVDAMDTKPTQAKDIFDELLDFDFSRLETVTSCGSSSKTSTEAKDHIKHEHPSKLVSSSSLSEDLFLNVYLYSSMPRPLAVNNFGLVKMPQSVDTTFRKNLHNMRKANNSPISLSSASGINSSLLGSTTSTAATGSTARFAANSKSSNYFTALGGTNSSGGSLLNEFSIGSITITNQTPNTPNLLQQQQLPGQKQQIVTQPPVEMLFNSPNANGSVTAAVGASSPPVSTSRASRPKSAGGINASVGQQSKQKLGNNSSTIGTATSLSLPPTPTKTIVVNGSSHTTDQTKFIKRSPIAKSNPLPTIRSATNLTVKQLSDILLHPGKDSKEKCLQILGIRDQDKDPNVAASLEQQKLDQVRNFYERRKRLLQATATAMAASTSPGYNHVRQLHTIQQATQSSSASASTFRQKPPRQRTLRTLSDCGIHSIKSNNNSANNNSSGDILRVFA